MELIDKEKVVAEIERIKKKECPTDTYEGRCKLLWFEQFLSFIDTLEVKEVDSLTDALIEKTWSWVEDNILSSNQQDKSLLYYEQLKNYIKE